MLNHEAYKGANHIFIEPVRFWFKGVEFNQCYVTLVYIRQEGNSDEELITIETLQKAAEIEKEFSNKTTRLKLKIIAKNEPIHKYLLEESLGLLDK